MAVLKKDETGGDKKHSYKYNNRLTVSYSNNMYLRIRNLSARMGIKIHDFQRAAVAYYVPIAEMEIESAARLNKGLKSERTANNENE